jgi:hypothetical protein
MPVMELLTLSYTLPAFYCIQQRLLTVSQCTMLQIITSVVSISLLFLLIYIVRTAKPRYPCERDGAAKSSAVKDKEPRVHEKAA